MKDLDPIILRTKNNKPIIIGSINGVNDKQAKTIIEKELTTEQISILFDYWCGKLAGVYRSFDNGMSGSYEIRMGPYSSQRMGYLFNFLPQKYAEEVEASHLDPNYPGAGRGNNILKNPEEKHKIKITEFEFNILINVPENSKEQK